MKKPKTKPTGWGHSDPKSLDEFFNWLEQRGNSNER
jgi:hypothetical protein